VKRKGFWDGGSTSHNSGDQSAGRNSGYPGGRRPSRSGVQIDLDEPTRKPAVGDSNSESR
jgi:hypothetical protein